MSNILQELVSEVENVLSSLNSVKAKVEAAVSTPNGEAQIVSGLVALLEANGYTVTPPAKQIDVQDGNAADGQAQ